MISGLTKAWIGTQTNGTKEVSFSGHTHAASAITSGTIAAARLPTATSSTQGAVKLGSSGGAAAYNHTHTASQISELPNGTSTSSNASIVLNHNNSLAVYTYGAHLKGTDIYGTLQNNKTSISVMDFNTRGAVGLSVIINYIGSTIILSNVITYSASSGAYSIVPAFKATTGMSNVSSMSLTTTNASFSGMYI